MPPSTRLFPLLFKPIPKHTHHLRTSSFISTGSFIAKGSFVTTRTLTSKTQTTHIGIPLKAKTMATSAPAPAPPEGKCEWLVILPDQTGMLERRMEVRPTHFQNLQPNIDNGFWKMGGALLTQPPTTPDSPLQFRGSAMIAVASTREEVLEKLKEDVYAVSGVWDFEKIQIYPFKCAFRNP